ncbi:MAG: alternate-type signal peptide domain-containing protein [Propionibacteriaceae bacterium]|jgi:alternate signal-mediated exported protein|nr:alternate-type signal peptide domain-containing protein [Propionibacteriaceae bacterium]
MNNESERRSRRFKGAIAGIAGIALLLGGGTTFAYWQEETQTNIGSLSAGTLDLTSDTSVYVYDISGDADGRTSTTGLNYAGKLIGSKSTSNQTVVSGLGSVKPVPGDTYEVDLKNIQFKLDGDHISGSLNIKSSNTSLPTYWAVKYTLKKGSTTVSGHDNQDASNIFSGSGLTLNGLDVSSSTQTYHLYITASYPDTVSGNGSASLMNFGNFTVTLKQNERPSATPSPTVPA